MWMEEAWRRRSVERAHIRAHQGHLYGGKRASIADGEDLE